jgi:hypothetical protein
MDYKLLKILPSNHPEKKMMAIFQKSDGRKKTIHFGASGYTDFTQPPHSIKKRDLYRKRHIKDLDTEAGKIGVSAGALSYWVLWGNSPSMTENIRVYRRLYGL